MSKFLVAALLIKTSSDGMDDARSRKLISTVETATNHALFSPRPIILAPAVSPNQTNLTNRHF